MNLDLRSILFLTLLFKKTYETLSFSTQLPLISSTKQLTLNDSTNEFYNEFTTSSEVITVNEIYNKSETYDDNTVLTIISTKSHKKFHRKKHIITNRNKNEDNEDDNESTTIARAVPTLKVQAFRTTASTIKPIIDSEVNKTGTDSKPIQVKLSEDLNINKTKTESNPNPVNAFITIKPVEKLPKTKPNAKISKTKPNVDINKVNFPIIDEIDGEIKDPIINSIFHFKTRTPFTFSTSSHTFTNSKFNCDLDFCQIEYEKIVYFDFRCSGFARRGWLSCNCGLCDRSLCRTSRRIKYGLNSRFSGCYKGFCLC